MTESKRPTEAEGAQGDEALHLYELVAANGRDIILFMRRDDGRILEVNAAATKAYGYSREELLGLTVFDLRAEYTKGLTFDELGIADDHGILFETVHRRKDGSTFPAEVSAQGSLIRGTRTLVGVVRDITERKTAENRLRESEERYRRMFESHVAGFALHEIVCDANGVPNNYRFLEVNPAFERLTGLVGADILGRTVLEVLPVTEPIWVERYCRVAQTGVPDHFTSRSEALDRTYEVTAYPAGPGRFAVMFVDVTDRVRAETALRASEERLQLLVKYAPVGVAMFDREMRYLAVSRRFVSDYRLGDQKILGRSHYDIFPEVPPRWREIHQRCLAGAIEKCNEDPFPRLDGTLDWIRWEIHPWRNAADEIAGIILFSEIITERKQVEQKLAAEHERLAVTLQSIADAVIATDKAGGVTVFNGVAETLTGWKAEEAVGRPLNEVFNIISEITRKPAANPIDRVLSEGIVVGLANSTALISRNGTELPIADSGAPIRDATGNILGAVLVFRDQTEERKADQAVRESEQRLRLALDAAKGGTWEWDLRTNENTWSDGLWAIYGLKPRDRKPSYDAWLETIHPDDREHVERVVGEAARTGKDLNVEWRVRDPDGRIRWLTSLGGPIHDAHGALIRYMGVVLDTTERRRAEEALRGSEQKFFAIYDNAPYAITLAKCPEGTFTAVNDACERMFEVSRVDVLGKTSLELDLAVDFEERARLYSEIRTRGAVRDREVEFSTRSGERRIAAFTLQPIEIGGLQYLLGTAIDITERKRAEEALRESEERFRVIFEQAAVGVAQADCRTGRFVAVNDKYCEILGYSREEILASTWQEFTHPEELESDGFSVAQIEESHEPYSKVKRYVRKDGSVAWGQLTVTPLSPAGAEPALEVEVVQDITERRLLEEQLQQSQKLESIGRLAGGVAHDFNNLLTVILSCAEALKKRATSGSPVPVEDIDEIYAAGTRASDLTHQLLAFARKQVFSPAPVDLNRLVRNTVKMLGRVLGEDVALVTKLDPSAWPVLCDPGQVEQVIMNLAVNARDAMPGGGKLAIETAKVEIDETFAATNDIRSGSYVRLSMRDSGTGMAPEVKSHIFEPFFTTKPVGQGTGLGLATVYGIVKQSDGYILVESELGHGTTFHVYLPRIAEPTIPLEPSVSTSATGGTETILVVEDDPHLRRITVRALRDAGYAVLVANDGREAVEIGSREGKLLNLLVTDVVMPGLGGRAVADALRHHHPEMRVLYVSGYAEEAIVKHGVLDPGADFLPKPFTGQSLLARVRSILDRH